MKLVRLSAEASFPRLLDLPADLVIRRALLPRFPYAVVFYVHHSFTVSPDVFDQACRLFRERGIRVARPIVYREHGFFPGREIYFLDPSGNVLELRDPLWKGDMPTPTWEEIALQVASVMSAS